MAEENQRLTDANQSLTEDNESLRMAYAAQSARVMNLSRQVQYLASVGGQLDKKLALQQHQNAHLRTENQCMHDELERIFWKHRRAMS